jgi:hypothetical protein
MNPINIKKLTKISTPSIMKKIEGLSNAKTDMIDLKKLLIINAKKAIPIINPFA